MPSSGRGLGYETFNLESGTAYAEPSRNRPPAFVHIVIEAGDLEDAFQPFVFPGEGTPVRPGDGVMASRRREVLFSRRIPQALYLGRVVWGGRAGTLALAPPYGASATIHADHVVFRWRESGREYALSLHGWEPFSRVVPTLRAIIESLPSGPDGL